MNIKFKGRLAAKALHRQRLTRAANLRAIVINELEKSIREHRQCFLDDEWKAANIALGGLRNVAAFISSETRKMGNEECIAHLKKLTK
jgi:hypothetical protein